MSDFPQFRRYRNHSSWFRVNGPDNFDEIKNIAGKYYFFHFDAKILPDRNFIRDLLHAYQDSCEISTEDEFQKMLKLSTPSNT